MTSHCSTAKVSANSRNPLGLSRPNLNNAFRLSAATEPVSLNGPVPRPVHVALFRAKHAPDPFAYGLKVLIAVCSGAGLNRERDVRSGSLRFAGIWDPPQFPTTPGDSVGQKSG